MLKTGEYMLKIKKKIAILVVLVAASILPLVLWAGEKDIYGRADNDNNSEIYFTILHTNDEHSSLIPRGPAIDFHPEKENPTLGGIARLAGAAGRIRAEKELTNEPVLLINAGDFKGGAIYHWLILEGYAPELKLMQQAGYDIAVIGNHEFDLGPDILANYLKVAGYPEAHEKTVLLATNTHVPEDHPLYEAGIRRTYLKELDNGLSIGFFSLIGNDAVSVIVESGPVEFSCPHKTARENVAFLREKGADLIVAINHSGIDEDRELAEHVSGIDIIVGGHSHTLMQEPEIVNGTIIIQAGEYFQHLGVLELAYNPATGKVRPRNADTGLPYLLRIDHTVSPDPVVAASVDEYTQKLNELVSRLTDNKVQNILEPIAVSDFPLPNRPDNEENQLGNFVTDAMRIIVEKKTGRRVDIAGQGSGILRTTVVPGTMPHSYSIISFYDLMEAVALGSGTDRTPGFPIASFYLTGEEIRRVIEISLIAREHMGEGYFFQVSGLRYTYDPERIVLFQIPGYNLPFPSSRAVLHAERYIGEGHQTDLIHDYVPLERGDKNLYHVVTDYALLDIAVTEIDQQIPQLSIKPKDSDGNVVENHEDLILRVGGNELKLWQVVLEYLLSQPLGPRGYPQVASYYQNPAGRITTLADTDLLTWATLYLTAFYLFIPWVFLIPVLTFLVVFFVRRRRKARRVAT